MLGVQVETEILCYITASNAPPQTAPEPVQSTMQRSTARTSETSEKVRDLCLVNVENVLVISYLVGIGDG